MHHIGNFNAHYEIFIFFPSSDITVSNITQPFTNPFIFFHLHQSVNKGPVIFRGFFRPNWGIYERTFWIKLEDIIRTRNSSLRTKKTFEWL